MRRVQRGAFSSFALSSALDKADLDARDRHFLTDLVYGTLRHHIYLDACLAPYLKRPEDLPENVRNALRLGGYEVLKRGTPRHAAVDEWVEVTKMKTPRLAGLVNAVLRRVDEAKTLDPADLASTPTWLFDTWQRLFEEQARNVAEDMNAPKPLWLSVYHEDAAASLRREGCEVEAGPLADTLAVRPAKPLHHLEAFRNGWVQPQNPSSSLPVRILNPAAGERVLDLASGNGIKTAQLAALGAEVTAVELSGKKVRRAKRNLARLGFSVEHVVHDLREGLELPPAPKVLLDAPCSGTGTLRGHPEIKLRLQEDDLNAITALQGELLETAAQVTAKGGTLVYAVCALTEREGSGMIERFLTSQPDFQREDFSTVLPSQMTPFGRYILPFDGLDGFFIAKLRRV